MTGCFFGVGVGGMRLISNSMHIRDICSKFPRFFQISRIAMLLLLHITSFIYYIMEVVRLLREFGSKDNDLNQIEWDTHG